MKDEIQHLEQQIARLNSWRGWFAVGRKEQLKWYEASLKLLKLIDHQVSLRERMKDPVLRRCGGRRK